MYSESENFVNGSVGKKEVPQIEGGDKLATETQMATINALIDEGQMEKVDKKITKQEAANLIKELSQQKGKKK